MTNYITGIRTDLYSDIEYYTSYREDGWFIYRYSKDPNNKQVRWPKFHGRKDVKLLLINRIYSRYDSKI